MPRRRTVGSRPLADFVRRLPALATHPLIPEVAVQVERLADEVARTYFPAPDGFFDNPIEFHVLGMDGPHDTWQPIFEGYRTLAVAPFVGRTALDAIVRMGDGKRMLVSSREELDKLPGDALAAWSRICVLSDTALDEPEDGDAGRPSGLHAKISRGRTRVGRHLVRRFRKPDGRGVQRQECRGDGRPNRPKSPPKRQDRPRHRTVSSNPASTRCANPIAAGNRNPRNPKQSKRSRTSRQPATLSSTPISRSSALHPTKIGRGRW